jgi:hypothetical protein
MNGGKGVLSARAPSMQEKATAKGVLSLRAQRTQRTARAKGVLSPRAQRTQRTATAKFATETENTQLRETPFAETQSAQRTTIKAFLGVLGALCERKFFVCRSLRPLRSLREKVFLFAVLRVLGVFARERLSP